MKIVFDTNVLVRAAGRPDCAAFAAIQLALTRSHVPVVSDDLADETARVLAYPRVRELFRSTEVERAAFLEVYYAAAERFEPTSTTAVTADSADDPIAALAMQSGTEVLVTLDKHFYDPEARTRLEAAGVRVMTDVELLRRLRSEPEA